MTTDVEFRELHNKFVACEKITTVLLAEVCKYRDNVTSMLNHQAEFGVILAEIYDPALGVPSGEVTPRRVQTAPESVQAVDDFQAVMREMRDILLPEVDRLELTVVRPLTEMQNLMKLIRKTITKRDHKLVDYDRFRISLKKLQDKKERSLSDEKSIYKLESQLEVATADYEGLNGLLREELPGFFYYRTKLMEPIFHSFYFLQLRIYNILLDRMEPLSRSGYYDLTMDVLRGYEARKQDIAPTVEAVELITKRSVTATYTSKYGRPHQDTSPNGSAPGTPRMYGASTAGDHGGYSPPAPAVKPWQATATAKPWQTNGGAPQAAPKPWQSSAPATAAVTAPPVYSATPADPAASNSRGFNAPSNVHVHLAPSISGTIAATAAAAATSYAINEGKNAYAANKRPPPPVPKRIGVKMVVALYDYDAQQPGDLSFRKDDRIEIVERTSSADDWWTGKLNGRQGVFPGNYVQDM
ncbi:hypothetical protein CPC16_006431 [Podila verticillata]|nr:hypothetical protein BGZ59_008688 [Podila verticillata]KAF9388595.1 hypothetical protein CPC16_006431 [Podila verticillata]